MSPRPCGPEPLVHCPLSACPTRTSSTCTSTREYSILDGACRIPDLVARAAELEMPAVSLTDHGSMAGAVQLFKAAKGTGVKPVVGCEVYVADDRRAQQKGYAHLTLLAADNDGYANLIKLSSLGYLEGYYYKPRVDWELLERHAGGVIALSGCLSGRVCKALEESRRLGRVRRARPARRRSSGATTSTSSSRTPTSTYRSGSCRSSSSSPPRPACRRSRPATSTTCATRTRAPTRRCSASSPATRSRTRTTGSSRPTTSTSRRPSEMADDFPGHADALRRTLEVAERCNVEIALDRILLPTVPTA